MRSPTHAGLALALALALTHGTVARGQDDPDAPPADPELQAGFPWACFATTVAALGGLYVFVRRREQAVEADQRLGRGRATTWYCCACDLDVSGPACPHCRAANPFLSDPPDGHTGTRPSRGRAV
jgi:hypothetical protein